MTTTKTPQLPILSLSSLTANTPSALTALNDACSKIGFFYLRDHGIPLSTLNHILDLSRSFFLAASPAEKAALGRRAPDNARGYQQLGENVTQGRPDSHEAVDLYAPWTERLHGSGEEGILTGENRWPDTPSELRKEVEAYIELVKGVGAEIVRAMGKALGLKEGEGDWESLVGQVQKSFWVARLIGYPPLREGNKGISCGEHTGKLNYDCFFVLFLLVLRSTRPGE
jgi:isopenicillin N synthase-like dioxygenase